MSGNGDRPHLPALNVCVNASRDRGRARARERVPLTCESRRVGEDAAPLRLLVVVEDVFAIGERGVVVVPDVDFGDGKPRLFGVELRRPDGTVVQAEAEATIPFVAPLQVPPRLRHVVRLIGLAKADVPIGTEIWCP